MSRVLVALGAVGLALVVRWQTSAPAPFPVHMPETPATADSVQRGRQVYVSYGCVMCHGPEGKGGFANPNAETDGKVPGVQFAKEGYTPGELRQKVLDGVRTIGKADRAGSVPPYRMPGWSDRMTRAEVDDLVQYLFSLYPKSAEQKWR